MSILRKHAGNLFSLLLLTGHLSSVISAKTGNLFG